MTEEEAKKALFELHYEYMMHTPKEREALYEEYSGKRKIIRDALSKTFLEKLEEQKSNNKKQ